MTTSRRLARRGASPDSPLPLPEGMSLRDYPALFQAADATSLAGQTRYKGLIAWELALLVTGAAFAALATVPALRALALPLQPVLPALTAFPFLGALAVKLANRQRSYDADWFDGRAVAETVKTQTWRYAMRVAPYDSEAADRDFGADLNVVSRARPSLIQGLDSLPERPRQISPRMRAVRNLPLGARREIYVRDRLENQAEWYRRKAIAHRRAARRWFWASLVTEALAALLAVLSVLTPQEIDDNVVGFLAAVAASFTAWSQVQRHDELTKSYAVACQELLGIVTMASDVMSEADLSALVRDGEAAISREHTMWVAKRSDRVDLGA